MSPEQLAQCRKDIQMMRDAGHTHVPIPIATYELMLAALERKK